MAAVERARAAAEAQLEAAKALPAAYLRAVFEDEEARGWPTWEISEVASTSSGTTPPRARSDYYGGTVPWVKTAELRDGTILDTEEHVTDRAVKETSLRLLPRGTLLVAMYGQGQTRGRTGLLGVEATTNQACFAVLPNPSRFDGRFLQMWFRYSYARLRQESQDRGGNQPNLNGKVLRRQRVPIPAVRRQREIMRRLEDQSNVSDRLLQTTGPQNHTISELPAALLRRAFSGKL